MTTTIVLKEKTKQLLISVSQLKGHLCVATFDALAIAMTCKATAVTLKAFVDNLKQWNDANDRAVPDTMVEAALRACREFIEYAKAAVNTQAADVNIVNSAALKLSQSIRQILVSFLSTLDPSDRLFKQAKIGEKEASVSTAAPAVGVASPVNPAALNRPPARLPTMANSPPSPQRSHQPARLGAVERKPTVASTVNVGMLRPQSRPQSTGDVGAPGSAPPRRGAPIGGTSLLANVARSNSRPASPMSGFVDAKTVKADGLSRESDLIVDDEFDDADATSATLPTPPASTSGFNSFRSSPTATPAAPTAKAPYVAPTTWEVPPPPDDDDAMDELDTFIGTIEQLPDVDDAGEALPVIALDDAEPAILPAKAVTPTSVASVVAPLATPASPTQRALTSPARTPSSPMLKLPERPTSAQRSTPAPTNTLAPANALAPPGSYGKIPMPAARTATPPAVAALRAAAPLPGAARTPPPSQYGSIKADVQRGHYGSLKDDEALDADATASAATAPARARAVTMPAQNKLPESSGHYQKVPLANVFTERASRTPEMRSADVAAAAAELDSMLDDLGI